MSEIQGWMISAVIALGGIIAAFAITRFVSNQNAKRIDDIAKKVDEHSETISEHRIIVSNAVTMDQVDAKFLTRDLFRAHEKHIDQRFISIEKKLDDGFNDLKDILSKND